MQRDAQDQPDPPPARPRPPGAAQPPPRRGPPSPPRRTGLAALPDLPPPRKTGLRRILAGPPWLYAAIFSAAIAAAIAIALIQTSSDNAPAPPAAAAADQQQSPAIAPASDGDPQPSQPAQQQPSAPAASDSENAQQPAPAQAEPAAAPAPAAADPQAEPAPDLTGFTVPLAGRWRAQGDCSQPGALITAYPGHLPGADRDYRLGIHEGLDFYEWAACIPINAATQVLAAKAGSVIRADLQYVEVTPAEWAAFDQAGWRGEPILDRLRGRQVWIDHGAGVVTRYAHLGAIHPDIAEGAQVSAGQVIGLVGESGQAVVWEAPGTDLHLHFEIRINDQYLGQGLPSAQARLLYLNAFGISP